MTFLKDKNARIIILILFSALFVVCAGILIYQGVMYRNGIKDGDAAGSVGNVPPLDSYEPGETETAEFPGIDTDDVTIAPVDTQPVGPDTDAVTEPVDTEPVTEPVEADTTAPDTAGEYVDTLAPDETTTPPPSAYSQAVKGQISIKNLKKQNSDVIGWIVIEGANVSEPLIHYTDDSYYLRRSWLKKQSTAGCIFMEYKCSPDFSGYNTIIYGHRMRNKTMFGQLENFKTKSNWQKNPYIYVYTENYMYTYQIFAVYRTPTDSPTYIVGFGSDTSKQNFIDHALSKAMYSTGIKPTIKDKFITLSTCTGDQGESKYAERFIVQGVLVKTSKRTDQ